jgi:two-component system, OmpR family, KDP operon response regulator KdpE
MTEALDVMQNSPVDAAIVDLLLPDGNGLDLCRRLRQGSDVPIIILSAISEEDEKVAALEAGADDYITKPLSPRELLARLQAVMRRASPPAEHTVIRTNDLEVDLAARRVRHNGKDIHLTPTEFDLLRVLVLNRGLLMTHHALLTEVWGPDHAADSSVLRTHIARLRRKLDPPNTDVAHHVHTTPASASISTPTPLRTKEASSQQLNCQSADRFADRGRA